MPDPCLVFDDRQALAGAPGLHALIVGVGSYPYLKGGAQAVTDSWEMGQLSSTATSAHLIYEWLLEAHQQGRLPVPLATCRLLLSPTPAEAALAGVGAAAKFDLFSPAAHDWRTDCRTHRDGVALFYFAGHGIQRDKADAVCCFEDFLQPGFSLLSRSVALDNLWKGMSPTPAFDEVARTQLYFYDACRVRPKKLDTLAGTEPNAVFEDALEGKDDRCCPIYYGSISNHPAQAVPGDQTLFSLAVLECLKGDAAQTVGETAGGDVQWGVTVKSLGAALESGKIDQVNRRHQGDQTYMPWGAFKEGVICRLDAAPEVRVRVELVPPEAAQFGTLRLTRIGDGQAHQALPPIPHPYEHKVPAGIYQFELTFQPPHPVFKPAVRHWNVDPQFNPKQVQVS